MTERCPSCGQHMPVNLLSSEPVRTDIVISYPCVGLTKHWDMTEKQYREWQAAFPSVDVIGECRKALAWLNASPQRRKTARGMPKFLVGWLGRTNDRAPQRAPQRIQGAAPVMDFDWEDECKQTCKVRCPTAYVHAMRKPVAS